MQRPLRRDGDGGGIGTIPLAFRTLRSAGVSCSFPGRRELIREKRLAMRGKVATRYKIPIMNGRINGHSGNYGWVVQNDVMGMQPGLQSSIGETGGHRLWPAPRGGAWWFSARKSFVSGSANGNRTLLPPLLAGSSWVKSRRFSAGCVARWSEMAPQVRVVVTRWSPGRRKVLHDVGAPVGQRGARRGVIKSGDMRLNLRMARSGEASQKRTSWAIGGWKGISQQLLSPLEYVWLRCGQLYATASGRSRVVHSAGHVSWYASSPRYCCHSSGVRLRVSREQASKIRSSGRARHRTSAPSYPAEASHCPPGLKARAFTTSL